jgi:hypothetical protein
MQHNGPDLPPLQEGFKNEAAASFIRGVLLGIRAGVMAETFTAKSPRGSVFRIAQMTPERPPVDFGSEVTIFLPTDQEVLATSDVSEFGRITLSGTFLHFPIETSEYAVADITLALRTMSQAYYEFHNSQTNPKI